MMPPPVVGFSPPSGVSCASILNLTLRRTASPGRSALSSTTRFAQDDGLELAIYLLNESPPLVCRVFGESQSLFDSKLIDSNCPQARPRNVSFGPRTFGLGLGALGNHLDRPRDLSRADSAQPAPYGEFLAVAGALAQSAHESRRLPDYIVGAR
jgi:hypothetical protein